MASKHHHSISQFYLKFFVDPLRPNEDVWIYDKDRPGPRPKSVRNTAFENHRHTLEREDGTRTDQLEVLLAKIEGAAAPILRRWHDRAEQPTQDEIEQIAHFLGVMFALVDRTVEDRLEWMDEFDQWNQERVGRAAEAPLAIPGPGSHLVPEDRRRRALHLNLINTPAEVAMQLLTMNFCRCFAPTSAAFVTSDAPVTIVLQRGDRVSYANGLENPAVEVFFPISPKVCLLFDRRGRHANRRVNRNFVHQVNRHVAFNAEQFVFAHANSERIEKLMREAAVTRTVRKSKPGALKRLFDEHFRSAAPASTG